MPSQRISLALQGGGSHGAFTWGVLDRLLEAPHIEIEGISGASAGAMNAVVLAWGFTQGGREGARQALAQFWGAVTSRPPFESLPANPLAALAGEAAQGLDSLARKALLFMTRFYSPYQLNPFDINPLRDIVERQIDFARLRAHCRIPLFIATTRVSTGALRLFRTAELSADALLASACLPALHHSVEIDGEPYWDGGLAANPPLWPLVAECRADDTVAVLLHPGPQPELPKTAADISRRLTELSFSAGFSAELRGLALAKQEADRTWLPLGGLSARLRRLRLHVIDAPDYMGSLGLMSKANTHADFIAALHAEGRRHAERWLAGGATLAPVDTAATLARLLC